MINIYICDVYKSWNETWCMPEKVDIPTCGLYSFHKKAMWKIPGTAMILSSHVGKLEWANLAKILWQKPQLGKILWILIFQKLTLPSACFFGENVVKMAHKKNRMKYSKIVQNDSCLRWFPILLIIISGWSLGQVMCPVPSAGKKINVTFGGFHWSAPRTAWLLYIIGRTDWFIDDNNNYDTPSWESLSTNIEWDVWDVKGCNGDRIRCPKWWLAVTGRSLASCAQNCCTEECAVKKQAKSSGLMTLRGKSLWICD